MNRIHFVCMVGCLLAIGCTQVSSSTLREASISIDDLVAQYEQAPTRYVRWEILIRTDATNAFCRILRIVSRPGGREGFSFEQFMKPIPAHIARDMTQNRDETIRALEAILRERICEIKILYQHRASGTGREDLYFGPYQPILLDSAVYCMDALELLKAKESARLVAILGYIEMSHRYGKAAIHCLRSLTESRQDWFEQWWETDAAKILSPVEIKELQEIRTWSETRGR